MKIESSVTKTYNLLLTMDWDDIDKMTDWLDDALSEYGDPPTQLVDFLNILMEMSEE